MPVGDLVAEPPREPPELGREHHADGDRRAVPPLVALGVLDRVAERVPVVEDLAQRPAR